MLSVMEHWLLVLSMGAHLPHSNILVPVVHILLQAKKSFLGFWFLNNINPIRTILVHHVQASLSINLHALEHTFCSHAFHTQGSVPLLPLVTGRLMKVDSCREGTMLRPSLLFFGSFGVVYEQSAKHVGGNKKATIPS
jgi:hypothetical protein